MRIKTRRKTRRDREKRIEAKAWHDRFAWCPVNHSGYWVWLETIQRKRWYLRYWQWEYRDKRNGEMTF